MDSQSSNSLRIPCSSKYNLYFIICQIADFRRGYQVYKQVCAACHSMRFLAFRWEYQINIAALSTTSCRIYKNLHNSCLISCLNIKSDEHPDSLSVSQIINKIKLLLLFSECTYTRHFWATAHRDVVKKSHENAKINPQMKTSPFMIQTHTVTFPQAPQNKHTPHKHNI